MTDVSVDEQGLSSQTHLVTDADELHKSELLEQFYLTLRVMYLSAPPVAGSVVHERIDRLFKGDRSWRNAYEIEQILCFVLTPQQIETELGRRLAEAKALKLPYVDVIERELKDTSLPPADKRIVLHRLMNDLQWFYSKRVQHRAGTKRLMWRVSSLFVMALVTLILVLFIQFFAHQPAAPGDTKSAGATTNPTAGAEAKPVTGTEAKPPTGAEAKPGAGAAASPAAKGELQNSGGGK